MIPQITAQGTPYDIGFTHGRDGINSVLGSVGFYLDLFRKSSGLSQKEVESAALEFEPTIKEKWPAYHEEMRGIADGAAVSLALIIALNVRSEITFGLHTDEFQPAGGDHPQPNGDGCTSLAWHTSGASFLGQNWDWMEEQGANLIMLHIIQPSKPSIKMITEAGIIGKIGLNSAGVGSCFNAIKAKGCDRTKLPVHLACRMILDSTSKDEAVAALDTYGVASSFHVVVADRTGSVGLEWSATDVKKLYPDERGRRWHANHFLVEHPGVHDTVWMKCSPFRTERILQLCDGLGSKPKLELETFQDLFRDEKNVPFSVCRSQVCGSKAATLFNIVVDLESGVGYVKMGKPTEDGEKLLLAF